MQAVDTNVVVRLLVKDDPEQCQQALDLWRQLTANGGVFLAGVVVVETVWVLQRSYHFSRPEIVGILDLLMRTEGVITENYGHMVRALSLYATQAADFSDFVIIESARSAGALPLHTFDKKLIRCNDTRWVSTS